MNHTVNEVTVYTADWSLLQGQYPLQGLKAFSLVDFHITTAVFTSFICHCTLHGHSVMVLMVAVVLIVATCSNGSSDNDSGYL